MEESKGRIYKQRLKLLYLKDIFEELTDSEHSIGMKDITDALEKYYDIDVERKTVSKDIELLQTAYPLPIEHERGGKKYRLGSRLFEFSELKLIIDCIASSKTLTEKKSQELIEKLKKLCSKHERATLWGQIIVTDRAKTQNSHVHYYIQMINDAIANRRKLTFQYFYYDVDKKKKLSWGGRYYSIHPYAMIYVDNNYYVLGMDEKNETKHYRLDRMMNVSTQRSSGSWNKEQAKADLENFTKYTFSMHGGERVRVKMRFDNKLVSMVLDRFGHDTVLRKDGALHFIVEQPIAISSQFFGWMFSLGEKAEILSPTSVKEQMMEQMKKTLAFYESKETST